MGKRPRTPAVFIPNRSARVCEDGIGDRTLKIASWNVNSIRARVGHATSWLRDRQPDVLLIQELKGEVFPAEIFKDMGNPAEIAKRYNFAALRGSHCIGHTRMATESAVTL